MISENSKVGIGLVVTGITLYIMGFIFLCDRTLLLLGNLCFLAGLVSLIGFFGTLSFFLKKGKAIGSLIFFIGKYRTFGHVDTFLVVFEFFFACFLLKIGNFSLKIEKALDSDF